MRSIGVVGSEHEVMGAIKKKGGGGGRLTDINKQDLSAFGS